MSLKIFPTLAVYLLLLLPLWGRPGIPTPSDIEEGYLDSLHKMLVDQVKASNFAAAKVVADEIERVLGTKLTASNSAPCGAWIWYGGGTITTLYPGGKAINGGELIGAWKWTDEIKRRFEIRWGDAWLDKVTISDDSMILHIKNNANVSFDAHRILIPLAQQDAAATPGPTRPR